MDSTRRLFVIAAIAAGELLTAQTRTVRIASGLDDPVDIVAAPGDDQRLYIVEQDGRIRVWKPSGLVALPMLDIDVLVESAGEGGLLSLTFAPDFATSREFFVVYTNAGHLLVVARYRTLPGDPEQAEPGSGAIVFGPFGVNNGTGHNGGCARFGPDGYLYVSTGERGLPANSQSTTSLLGKLLRIDRNGSPAPGNPFGNEVWVLGLRNPWRFSFDRATGELYIGDVGESFWEEIDRVPGAGANFGWPATEGPFNPASFPSFTHPIAWQDSTVSGVTCAVIGGFVYRGCGIPSLQGKYVFTDYCADELRVIDPAATGNPPPLLLPFAADVGVISFPNTLGEDNHGELYICDYGDGDIYKIVSTTSVSMTYCTPGTTSSGCLATMAAVGAPCASATSGFTLSAENVEAQKQGLIFYGLGPNSLPWSGSSTSFLCVKSPTQRMPAQSSGGIGSCSGRFSNDWLAFLAAHPTAFGAPFSAGTSVYAQAWFRDPSAPDTTNLSNGLMFTTAP